VSKAVHSVWSHEDRKHLASAIMDEAKVPNGTRVHFTGGKRTSAQSAKFHAMIGEVARQATHNGRRYPADDWKAIFLHALGQEMRFLPALDGLSFIPIGNHSSELSKEQMSDAIEMIFAWGAEHGVKFKDPIDPPGPAPTGPGELDPPTIDHDEREFERPEF
jgi:hypothetical protein